MKANCPVCSREIEVLSNGKAEFHWPSPKVTLTPTQPCDYSYFQIIPVTALSKVCTKCGKTVAVSIEGRPAIHYAGPDKTLSPDRPCWEDDLPVVLHGSQHPKDSVSYHWEPGNHTEFNP